MLKISLNRRDCIFIRFIIILLIKNIHINLKVYADSPQLSLRESARETRSIGVKFLFDFATLRNRDFETDERSIPGETLARGKASANNERTSYLAICKSSTYRSLLHFLYPILPQDDIYFHHTHSQSKLLIPTCRKRHY